jgi:hypothetical protein
MINKYNWLLKIDGEKIIFDNEVWAKRQFNITVRDNPKAKSIVLLNLYTKEIIAFKGEINDNI